MKVKKIEVFEVGYDEVERSIAKFYGLPENADVSVIAMEEWVNDSDHLFVVSPDPLDKWERKDVQRFKANPSGAHYVLHSLLQDMSFCGYIEPGQYLITVCW